MTDYVTTAQIADRSDDRLVFSCHNYCLRFAIAVLH